MSFSSIPNAICNGRDSLRSISREWLFGSPFLTLLQEWFLSLDLALHRLGHFEMPLAAQQR